MWTILGDFRGRWLNLVVRDFNMAINIANWNELVNILREYEVVFTFIFRILQHVNRMDESKYKGLLSNRWDWNQIFL